MILGTICARAGSKGIPGKHLKLLDGMPLIDRTLDICGDIFDEIVISSDDQAVNDYAKFYYPKFRQLFRPAELATDTASKWDVFRYISEQIPNADIIVDLDIGCPFREYDDIVKCVEKLRTGYAVVATAYQAERNPYFNMVEVDRYGLATIVNHNDVFTSRQAAPQVWSLSPSVFAIDRKALYQYSHWSQSVMGIVEVPRVRGFDIDTPEDWEYAKYLVGRMKEK